MFHSPCTRRGFLVKGSALAVGLATLKVGQVLAAPTTQEAEQEVTANEDLMREHGLLERLLLILEEGHRRLLAGEEPPVEALAATQDIIDRVFHGYHEKDEEEHVFPPLIKADKEKKTVEVLIIQHKAGRELSVKIKKLIDAKVLKEPDNRKKLAALLMQNSRMYRPHMAREDTIVFPLFKETVGPRQYDRVGDLMEEKEQQVLGEDGFEKAVAQAAKIEQQLGIGDLAKFTAE